MPRLVEVANLADAPATLEVEAGDILLFDASGVRIGKGEGVVETIGSFVRSVAAAGRVLTPAGAPNAVLVAARRPGTARVTLIVGDPFAAAAETEVEIRIAGPA